METKYFWCTRWRQQIAEEVCIARYKKGLKKCSNCPKGKEIADKLMSSLAGRNQ